ncbi:MAG: beta-ketoacyl synthase [Bacteroidales bacterium]|jgi:3-oxoacyl-[acyl-carrier-protein] synthase-1|nr:beta-ketoacyl synthase [Bacteroidales bacterium]
MIYKINDNIISALGFSSIENFEAVCAEKSGLQIIKNLFDLEDSFCVSKINSDKIDAEFDLIRKNNYNYTKLEKMSILSVFKALQNTDIQPYNNDVLFILSTTKGNIDILEKPENFEKDRIFLWKTAQIIAGFFENKNNPIVVSNACISGIASQLTAFRNLKLRRYRYAIVIGVDILSKFTVSGFNSFKALSSEICKPFDINRCGLNIGEAAATIIYGFTENQSDIPNNSIILENISICNDANHISGPSRTAEGLNLAIYNVLDNINKNSISFINVHGTATPYNDNMESIAIYRNNLNNIPINSLKAYYGHTLGAAGILETIISSCALQNSTILVSKGFEKLGVDYKVNVNTKAKKSEKSRFLKLISGFGGTNASAIFRKL